MENEENVLVFAQIPERIPPFSLLPVLAELKISISASEKNHRYLSLTLPQNGKQKYAPVI